MTSSSVWGVRDLEAYFAVGHRVARTDKVPQWKPGNEFKPVRAAMLKNQ